QDLGAALGWLDEALARRGVAGALASGTAGDYQRGVAETLAISMESLTPEHRACAEVLGAMAEDSVMTLASAARLWGVDAFDAEDIASTLDDRSLISRLDLGAGSFELHDRLRDVLAARAGPERLRDAQARLVAGWRAETGGHWELLRDSYALEHLPSHLRAMGDADGLAALLLDPAWMTAKLRGLGVQRLLADYRAHAPDRGSALGLVRQALHLAAPALAVAPEELPAQLLGRLAEEDGPEIATLRQQARRLAARGSLLPLRRSLTGPGAELMRLLGHEDAVFSVGFSPDGARLVSGGRDGTLRIWDAASGSLLTTLTGHEVWFRSVSFSPDGARLVSGGSDRTLRLWDATSGALLASLRGHERPVFSVRFSP
ncbi:MAG: WD40 repeat domain-containing protein, partial [Acetobacteraceae bacterium]